MDSMKKGFLLVIASAFIFGATPILTRITYDEGSNGVTMTFLRSALAVPFLFAVMKIRKIPFASSKAETRGLLLAGIIFAVTVTMMYSSYAYIPVGEAVTLHFIYPALVSFACVVFYKEKLTKPILAALALSVAGVVLFSENLSFSSMDSGAWTGFLLALASGFTYAFYMIQIDKSALRWVPTAKISFALCVMGTLCTGIYGRYLGRLSFDLSAKGWAYTWIITLSVSLFALAFLQLGIKYTGAAKAAILSTFEPITGVLCGAFFLNERLSFPKTIGCVCIIASVILVTTTEKTAKNQAVSP